MKNSTLVVILVVFLLFVIVNGSDLPECEAETSCPRPSCDKVPLTMSTTTSNVLCIDKGSPSSFPLYLIEDCNGTYTNFIGNTSGICVVTDKQSSTVDLYLTVSKLSIGVKELNCFIRIDGVARFITLTTIVFQVDVEFDVVTEINGEASEVLPDSDVTVTDGDNVTITARAVGGEPGIDISSVPCDDMGNNSVHVPCQRGFLCSSLLSGRDVPGRYAQYSFSPVTVNEAGLNISFTLGSIVRNVTLNVTERPPSPPVTSPTPTSTTTKTPEDDSNTLSTGGIIAIVLAVVIIVGIVAIVAIVVLVWKCTSRDQTSSTSIDYHSTEKGVNNAYQQLPGPNPHAKAMIYLCPNCMDDDKIVSELKNTDIEIVDLPDESLTFMDIRNELYSSLDDGVALIVCDCPRATESDLRRVVQRITNLPSEAVETKTWTVFVIRHTDQDTNKLLDSNKVVDIVYYTSTNDAVQKIRSRVEDGYRKSITEDEVKKRWLSEQLKEIKTEIHSVRDQATQNHEETMEGIQVVQTGQDVLIKEALTKPDQ